MRKTIFIGAVVVIVAAGLFAHHASGDAPASGPTAVQAMLIKNTLTAVNHGTITGNYTVLRDLSSERFQQLHTATDLGATFRSLREGKLDLSPILLLDPELSERPVESGGRLKLVGYFATQPQRVQFGLLFERVEAGWMIDDIAISFAQAEAPPQAAAPSNSGRSALPPGVRAASKPASPSTPVRR